MQFTRIAEILTVPIGCLSYRNLNFEIKTDGPHTRLRAGLVYNKSSYATISFNITTQVIIKMPRSDASYLGL